MKKPIRDLMAVLAGACLFAALAPAARNGGEFPLLNWHSETGQRNFYFAKRQWLADARTIVAAVRYLTESGMGRLKGPAETNAIAQLPLPRPTNTNLFGIRGAESSLPLDGANRAKEI